MRLAPTFKLRVALIPIFVLLITAAEASSSGEESVLCVERSGEMGRLNVTPVTVSIDQETDLTILGEEQMCLRSAREGTVRLQLRFRYPYYGAGEKLLWWTAKPVRVTLKHGRTTRVMLCPRTQNRNGLHWERAGWHRMWVLSPPESPKACGPLYAK